MALIPAPPVAPEKAPVPLRLERSLHDQLTAYAEFIGSTKEYIISAALRRVFRQDKDFAAWLQRRPPASVTSQRKNSPSTSAASDRPTAPESGIAPTLEPRSARRT